MWLTQPSTAVIMALKGARVGLLALGLFLAARVFVPMYEEQTFGQRKPPPGLWRFMLIWLAFDVALTGFLVALVVLARMAGLTADLVDDEVLRMFAVDYAASTTSILSAGLMIGRVLQSRKYFRYETEGGRAIRAMASIMFHAGSVIMWMPAFTLMHGLAKQ